MSESNGRPFLVTGPPASGKTVTVLSKLRTSAMPSEEIAKADDATVEASDAAAAAQEERPFFHFTALRTSDTQEFTVELWIHSQRKF